jgi:hypothetical protein
MSVSLVPDKCLATKFFLNLSMIALFSQVPYNLLSLFCSGQHPPINVVAFSCGMVTKGL